MQSRRSSVFLLLLTLLGNDLSGSTMDPTYASNEISSPNSTGMASEVSKYDSVLEGSPHTTNETTGLEFLQLKDVLRKMLENATEERKQDDFDGASGSETAHPPFIENVTRNNDSKENSPQEDIIMANESSVVSASPSKSVRCSKIFNNDTVTPVVTIVNASVLAEMLTPDPNVTQRSSPAKCVVLFFYASWCPYSTAAAPHFHALSRAFPEIDLLAIDAMENHKLNTRYGIVALPTILLFHNGRAISRFNESEYVLEKMASFLSLYTSTDPADRLNVTSADFFGPLPSTPVAVTDYWLWASWLFLSMFAVIAFLRSSYWWRLVECLRKTWQEAEAQHEHID